MAIDKKRSDSPGTPPFQDLEMHQTKNIYLGKTA
jgi:hypothetical protein